MEYDLIEILKRDPSTVFCFRLNKWPLAAIRLENELYIFRDRCPHMGSSFEGGWIENGRLVCPDHRYRFDPREQDPNRSPGCLSLLEWRTTEDGIEINLN
jgi:nitrite reductase/ring-hydroxylating ferredoxin subunit